MNRTKATLVLTSPVDNPTISIRIDGIEREVGPLVMRAGEELHIAAKTIHGEGPAKLEYQLEWLEEPDASR